MNDETREAMQAGEGRDAGPVPRCAPRYRAIGAAMTERWGMTLALIKRSQREHRGYWMLVSFGYEPENMGEQERASLLP